MIGEIYKMLFKNKEEAKQKIPLLLTFIGGLTGIVLYLIQPDMILDAKNIGMAFSIGMVSGASSTGANQMIKQWMKKNESK